MANLTLTAETAWIHDTDMSGFLHQVNAKITVAELENTTFASGGYRSRLGGLKTIALQGNGYWDSTPDASLFPALGVNNRVITVSPQGAETNVTYLWRAGEFDYEQYAAVGAITPFAINANSSDSQGIIRGQMASKSRTISATGQVGSVLTMTGPSASQFVYASLHVFTAGTTVTVIVESAPAANFAAPTTRGTLGPITTTGGTWLARVVGAITDGFWRLNCTNITGSFVVAGAIGIQ